MIEEPAGPRIDPLPADEGAPRQLNIFRTLAHNEALSKGFLQLGGHLLGGEVLPVREREIVIFVPASAQARSMNSVSTPASVAGEASPRMRSLGWPTPTPARGMPTTTPW